MVHNIYEEVEFVLFSSSRIIFLLLLLKYEFIFLFFINIFFLSLKQKNNLL